MIAVLFMLFLGTVFLFPSTPQTSVADMNYTVVVLGGIMILSLVWYYFPKYGGVYWFTGPVPNIDIQQSGLGTPVNGSAEYMNEGKEQNKEKENVSTLYAARTH